MPAVINISAIDAIKNTKNAGFSKHYPSRNDRRSDDVLVLPIHRPKFGINFDSKLNIFTIGSCFARNIEHELELLNVSVPTRLFRAEAGEWDLHPTELLNEYTPGAIRQRILEALSGPNLPPRQTLAQKAELVHDLTFSGNNVGILERRALLRRHDRAAVYRNLAFADVAIVTLGHIEGWFDTAANYWLNQMPVNEMGTTRYDLRQLDVNDVVNLLDYPLSLLTQGECKVILTVSPIPMHTTFSGADCVTANEYSKATLRAAAQLLSQTNPNIDYFPSYEAGRSVGISGRERDNIHLKQEIVRKILLYMVSSYGGNA